MCHLGSALEAESDELATQEAIEFIDHMASIKVPMISVYGGEPLTRDDFFILAGHAHNKWTEDYFIKQCRPYNGANRKGDCRVWYLLCGN